MCFNRNALESKLFTIGFAIYLTILTQYKPVVSECVVFPLLTSNKSFHFVINGGKILEQTRHA